ncbi:hypothetical protein PANT_15c00042 [Moesziomyces antarcticus T-34]|uniref:Uncharacterized protein n=1 Tax=Pseudozyma antarctica (strain T-34) TaxID=1151754 RepID=M9MEK0_PSEA3|nr:hypothetical protein PANT_15c00042 [Moesziomyces antarcticus T-34]
MPPIIDPEERKARAEARNPEHEEDEEDEGTPILEEIRALLLESEASTASRTTEPRSSQIARIDFEIKYRQFVQRFLPKMMERRMTTHHHDLEKDAFAYEDVPALIERMKLFLTHMTMKTKGRTSLREAPRVAKSTIWSWRDLLIKSVVRYVQDHEDLASYDFELRKVLSRSADSREGLVFQLSDHIRFLIRKFKLPSTVKPKGVYSGAEVQLILNDMFKRLPAGSVKESLLQRIILVQTCFITGLRIGSLVAIDREDELRHGMRQSDVSFTTLEHGAWTLHLHITHLKGFLREEDTMHFNVRMRPLRESPNILLEPTPLFLLLLINRKALRADGPDGPLINSVDELLSSSAHRFVGVGDEAMFRQPGHSELDVSTACNQLMVHTSAAGLPFGGYHRLRQDFATDMQLMFGSTMARELMHHDVERDNLNRYYTGGVELFDLVGIRTGEATQTAHVRASNREDAILSGFAHRYVALTLQDDGIDPREDAGPFLKGTTVPSSRPTRKKYRSHEDMVAYARETNKTFAALLEQYDAEASIAQRLLGIPLPYTRLPQKTAVKQALARLAASKDTRKHREAKAAWESLLQLRTRLGKEKTRSSTRYGVEKKREIARAVTGTSSVAISRGAMTQAQARLAPRRPQPPGTMQTAGSSRQTLEDEVSNIDQVAEDEEQLPTDDEFESSEDGIEDEDRALPDDDVFDQAQVIEGDHYEEVTDVSDASGATTEEPPQPSTAQPGRDFRISWLRFLEGISHARERERKLLDFMYSTGFCPLCPHGSSHAFPSARSHQQIGLFEVTPERDEHFHYHSVARAHLIDFHPNELTALRAGEQLNPGAFQCPLVPSFVPNIYFQADQRLEDRYLAPASLPGYFDRMSDGQKVVLLKHMEPTLYVDRSNESQVEWADYVVGRLLTSQNKKPEGPLPHSASKQKQLTRSMKNSASYPWPQRNPLFPTGPFADVKGERYPLAPMHDFGLLPHGEWTTDRLGIKWDDQLLKASVLPENLVNLPLRSSTDRPSDL